MLGQDANTIRKKMEKMTQKHVKEITTLQQHMLEVNMQKTLLSPMCIMLECVKFEFNEIDIDITKAEIEVDSLAKTHKQDSEKLKS
jgi:hypothetical protein